jgi:hypothetical protein
MKSSNQKLKLILGIVILAGIILLVVIAFNINSPKLSGFKQTQDITDSTLRHEIYTLKNTTVFLNYGNIYNLKCPALEKSAIAIPTKSDLGSTFYPASANSRLFKLIKGKTDSLNLIADFEFLRKKYTSADKLVWSDKLKHTYPQINNVPIYLAAGIPAKSKTVQETELAKQENPNKIYSVVKALCSSAYQNKDNTIAMTFFGTGAAGVDEEQAMTSILKGINQMALLDQAPKQITIVLRFPIDSAEIGEKNAWLKYKSEMFAKAINNNKHEIWNYDKGKKATMQIIALIVLSCLTSLLALFMPSLKERLWWGPILNSTIKWSLITTGVFILTRDFSKPIEPLPTTNFLLFMVACIIIPLWDWSKMNELKNPSSN